MRVRVQKWGNSLALRIPKPFAAEAHLEHGSMVDVSVADGKLVVVPVAEPPVTLDRLLSGITEENLHQGVESGPARGREVW